MGAKSIFVLAAVSLVIIIAASVFLGLFIYDNFVPHSIQLQTTSQSNPDLSKPNILTSGLMAQDVRSIFSCSLHVSGSINNTGGGTAYNASLHIVANNKEGTAVDTYYSFGGLTGHRTLGLNFRLGYSGSPIDSCTITPVYTDSLPPISNGTASFNPSM